MARWLASVVCQAPEIIASTDSSFLRFLLPTYVYYYIVPWVEVVVLEAVVAAVVVGGGD